MSGMTLTAIQAELEASPAVAALGMRAVALDAATATLELVMPISDVSRRARNDNQFHGGAIASFADTAGDFAVAATVGGGVPTINMRVDYLRPAAGQSLRAVARPRRVGRTVAVVDVDILDTAGRVCAVGRATYATAVG